MKKINWKNVATLFFISLVFFGVGVFFTLYKVNEALAYRGIVMKFEIAFDQFISVIQK